MDVYREVCAHIRATDDTSLKLLAAVPLATGIGVTILVRTSTQDLPGVARSVLSLFAAVITFAIYRWERKNVATCVTSASGLPSWSETISSSRFQPGKRERRKIIPMGCVSAPVLRSILG